MNIPADEIPKQLIEGCEEMVAKGVNPECELLLELTKLKANGALEPGVYSQDELRSLVDAPMP